MGKNSKRNCGNVCEVCNHKDCAMYLYSFEELEKMFEKDSTSARQMKMIKEHLKDLVQKK